IGPSFVTAEERLLLADEQDGVPAWLPRLLSRDLRLRPLLAIKASQPDANVVGALLLAAEPRGEELARLHLDDRRSVTGSEGGLLEDEHRCFSDSLVASIIQGIAVSSTAPPF